MEIRSRNRVQENGGSGEVDPSVTQYCEVPYAYDQLERERDLSAIAKGGTRFPISLCLLATGSALSLCVFIMPFCAIIKAPTERLDIPWWKRGVIYNIHVASFYDSDGDGIGDIRGIVEKLDYIESLGVMGVELSSFYTGCGIDNDGRQCVTNHTHIDPMYGSLADLDQLIKQLHLRDMKLLIPFIPNHTSDEHPWFVASTSHSLPYADFYVWDQGNENQPPNNWVSEDGGSAWTFDSTRGQFYYHSDSTHHPDLNLRNPHVQQAMAETLLFWLMRGVDGFRVHGVDDLIETNDTSLIEPPSTNPQLPGLDRVFTSHQTDSLHVMSAFHRLVQDYAHGLSKDIPFIPTITGQFTHPDYWFSAYKHGSDMPVNQGLSHLDTSTLSGHAVDTAVNQVMASIPFNRGTHWITWNTEDMGVSRVWSGYNDGLYSEAALALTLLLPGTGIIYYGQEIGLTNLYNLTPHTIRNCIQGKVPYDRTTCYAGRGLMQWNNDKTRGFSTSTSTWLPPNPASTLNVPEGVQSSLVEALRTFIALRRDPAFMLGQINPMVVNDHIYSFCRISRGRIFPKYFLTMNLGTESSTDNYRDTRVTLKIPEDFIEAKIDMPANGTVIYHSATFAETSMIGQVVNIQELTVKPGQVLVIKL